MGPMMNRVTGIRCFFNYILTSFTFFNIFMQDITNLRIDVLTFSDFPLKRSGKTRRNSNNSIQLFFLKLCVKFYKDSWRSSACAKRKYKPNT